MSGDMKRNPLPNLLLNLFIKRINSIIRKVQRLSKLKGHLNIRENIDSNKECCDNVPKGVE